MKIVFFHLIIKTKYIMIVYFLKNFKKIGVLQIKNKLNGIFVNKTKFKIKNRFY